jgi:hypothetical protein
MEKEKLISRIDKADFEMFTTDGNNKVRSIIKSGVKKVYSKKRITEEDLYNYIGKKVMKASVKEKYGEILDSEPPSHICFWINQALADVSYSFRLTRWDLSDAAFNSLKHEDEKV